LKESGAIRYSKTPCIVVDSYEFFLGRGGNRYNKSHI